MTDNTARERQARFAARIREQGLVKICEWVPAECRDTLKTIAREMRDGAQPPEPEVKPLLDYYVEPVLTAHAWGWAPNAIAAYLGISVERVEQILEERNRE